MPQGFSERDLTLPNLLYTRDKENATFVAYFFSASSLLKRIGKPGKVYKKPSGLHETE